MKRLLVLFFGFLFLFPFFSGVQARTWRVTVDGNGDAPTIQAAVDSAVAGDLILVAEGRYTWTNQGTGSQYGLIKFLRDKKGFELRSESGPGVTTLDAEGQGRVLYLMAYNDLTIDGFTITGGVAPSFGEYAGGGIAAHLSSPIFRNCVVTNNSGDQGGGMWFGGVGAPYFDNCHFINNTATYGGGVFLINSTSLMFFINCTFRGNVAAERGGGIFSYHNLMRLEDCAISGNSAGVEGGAIFFQNSFPTTIQKCTIAENGAPTGGGLRIFGTSSVYLNRSIIAFGNQGGALSLGSGGALTIECSDIYGNNGGDGFPPGTIDNGGNFSQDPQFCGMLGTHYYHLQGDSPCVPGNHPNGWLCGIIGMYPVSCGTSPSEEKTWGAIKSFFVEQ